MFNNVDEDDFARDEDDLAQKANSANTPINNDIEPNDKVDIFALVGAYKKYYEDKNDTNISLRKKYFNCSFALIFILVFGFIGTTILVCLFVKDNLTIIISLVSSIGGLVPSVLVLPRIIGKYIFPENEYDGTKDAIDVMKNSDKPKKGND